MTVEEARQLIGVEGTDSAEGLQEAFRKRVQELESKLERAPTPSLKEKYRRGLTQLEEAWAALAGLEGNDASPNFPSLHPIAEREVNSLRVTHQSESKKQKDAAQLHENSIKGHKKSAKLLMWLCAPIALFSLSVVSLSIGVTLLSASNPDEIYGPDKGYNHWYRILMPCLFLTSFYMVELWIILAFFSYARNSARLRPHIVWRLVLFGIVPEATMFAIYLDQAYHPESATLLGHAIALYMASMLITVLIIAGPRFCEPILLVPQSRNVPKLLIVLGIFSCLAVLFVIFTIFLTMK